MASTTTKTKYRCMQCELTEEKCQCDKYCCLCQSQIDIRLFQDGLYYCPPSCEVRVRNWSPDQIDERRLSNSGEDCLQPSRDRWRVHVMRENLHRSGIIAFNLHLRFSWYGNDCDHRRAIRVRLLPFE